MNEPFLKDIANMLKSDPIKADKSFYGVVKEVVTDDSGKVKAYKVSLGGDDDIIECRKFAGAEVGDIIMVTLMANGTAVVTGRRDGDGDAMSAEAKAQSVVDRADAGDFDGAPGEDGKSAYQSAIEGGMPSTTTEEQFNSDLADTPNKANTSYVDAAKAEAINTASADATAKADEAAKTATDFIQSVSTQTTDDGVKVFPKSEKENPQNYLNIDNDSVDIYKDGDMVASFGEDVILGQDVINSNYVKISYQAFAMYDYTGKCFAEIKNMKGRDGFALIEEFVKNDFGYPNETINVSYNVIETKDIYCEDPNGNNIQVRVHHSAALPDNFRIIERVDGLMFEDKTDYFFRYYTNDEYTKSYTFGTRAEGPIGAMSFVEGQNNLASANSSHAEGKDNIAIDLYTHVEGIENAATGMGAHAEGRNTEARGWYSHVEGYNTIAQLGHEHVEGTYNALLTDYEMEVGDILPVHVVGNGTISKRSNAYMLTREGIGRYMGDVYVGCDADSKNGYKVTAAIEGTTTAGSVTWEYKKYKGGVLEMWGSANTTLAISTAMGGIYTTANTYDVAIPSFVSSVKFITSELSGGGWSDITNTYPPQVRFYAPTAYGSASRTIRYYLKGTWK